MTPIPGTPASAVFTPLTPGFPTKRNIIDHPFYGFTDVRNPEFHPPPSPVRPPAAVPRWGYKGEFEKPSPRPIEPPLPPKGSPKTGLTTFSGKTGNSNFGTTGLKNLGNTCYMNSILQCMNGTIPLSRYFMDGSYKQHINKENVLGSRGVLAEAFANVVRHLWDGQYKFISPMTFKEVSGRLNEMFKTSDQQDAQEFLEFLLDGLHEDLNPNASRTKLQDLTLEDERVRERLPDPYASFLEWQRYTHRNFSVVVNWFQGQLSSRLTCLTCNTRSTTYSPFMYLSLPVPPKKNPTILDCLEEFCTEETLEKEDAWQCPKCKKPRKATKKLTITRLPHMLIIHLKRFTNKGPWRDKLNTPIEYPLKELDLSKYVPQVGDGVPPGWTPPPEQTAPFLYDLYGVCNHYGTLNGGHYTAFVRNTYDEGWNLFDDSKASKVPEEVVMVSPPPFPFASRAPPDTATSTNAQKKNNRLTQYPPKPNRTKTHMYSFGCGAISCDMSDIIFTSFPPFFVHFTFSTLRIRHLHGFLTCIVYVVVSFACMKFLLCMVSILLFTSSFRSYPLLRLFFCSIFFFFFFRLRLWRARYLSPTVLFCSF